MGVIEEVAAKSYYISEEELRELLAEYARNRTEHFPVGTKLVDIGQPEEFAVVVEPTELDVATGCAESCSFEGGGYVFVEWQDDEEDPYREWVWAEDMEVAA